MHNRGIIILTLGRDYAGWAVNYCASLRIFHPSEAIRCVADADAISVLQRYADRLQIELVPIRDEHRLNYSRRFSPGWAKLNVIHYVPESWQRVMFTDIDTICTASIEPIWAETGAIRSALTGRCNPDAGKWGCQWMPLDEVRKRFALNPDAPLLEVNSSLFLFDREAGVRLYEQARKHYDHNWTKALWGGTFPDELAINIALNQLGYDYADLPYMDFGSEKNRPLLAFYGGLNFQQRRHTDKYDRYSKVAFQKLFNKPTPYTFQHLIKKKHVSSGSKQPSTRNHAEIVIRNNVEALTPLFPTYLAEPIRAESLIKDTGFGRVPCHTNPAIIRHGEEWVFAYRTEQKPFWQNSRIVVTELGADLQPLREGDVLDLGHSEDPRMYHDANGVLMLSYTDGKAMFRARLVKKAGKWEAMDAERMQRGTAKLADSDGREKNWMPIEGLGLFVSSLNGAVRITNGNGAEFEVGQGVSWEYGAVRGSTPIVPIDGGYLGLFHSKRHVKMFDFSIYYVGAFTMDADFNVTGWTPEYIISPPFMPETIERPHWKICCAFPCGLVVEGDSVIIASGENDCRCVLYRVGLGELLKSVKRVALN
jgi:hypothetical protein